MKKGLSRAIVATGAAVAMSLSGCASGEIQSERIELTDSSLSQIDAKGIDCATKTLGNTATFQVFVTMAGSRITLETPQSTLEFTDNRKIGPDVSSILGAIAVPTENKYTAKIVNWHNPEGLTATVDRSVDPAQLLVTPGSKLTDIISAIC